MRFARICGHDRVLVSVDCLVAMQLDASNKVWSARSLFLAKQRLRARVHVRVYHFHMPRWPVTARTHRVGMRARRSGH